MFVLRHHKYIMVGPVDCFYHVRLLHPEKGGGLWLSGLQMLIFRNRYAPIPVIAMVKPPMTAKQMTGLICETPVKP